MAKIIIGKTKRESQRKAKRQPTCRIQKKKKGEKINPSRGGRKLCHPQAF